MSATSELMLSQTLDNVYALYAIIATTCIVLALTVAIYVSKKAKQ